MPNQTRLDILVVEKRLASSREKAQGCILAGEVWLGNHCLDKPGTKVDSDAPIEVRSKRLHFVSRAGLKLAQAVEDFSIDVSKRVCLDVGSSTGGFTDVLLKGGATHVFCVDVGYGQLDYQLRKDPRTSVLEKVNARYLKKEELVKKNPLADQIDFVCADVSFISLRQILPALGEAIASFEAVFLFKPQFELGRQWVEKGGIVRDARAIEEGLKKFEEDLGRMGYLIKDRPRPCDTRGKKSGNLEFLVHCEKK